MRVGIIVDAYQPFRSSAAIQITDLACEFALEGHDIVVITPAAGQKEPWLDEFCNGVRVLRLSHHKRKISVEYGVRFQRFCCHFL